jgi:hypothetical protein
MPHYRVVFETAEFAQMVKKMPDRYKTRNLKYDVLEKIKNAK